MRPHTLTRGRLAGTVARVRQVTPRMVGVRLVVDGLVAMPGQTIRIYVPDQSGQPVSRDYTVRAVDAATSSVDIDFVLHGAGPAADWARQVQPGQCLEFVGPSGRYRPDPESDWHLFVGDETALPAIQAYVAMLPVDACAALYLEVADDAEQQPIPGAAHPVVRWLHRGDRPPGTSTVLEDALRGVRLPPGQGRIWIAGHTPTVRRIRATLLDQPGIDRRTVYARGFWDRHP